MELSTFVAFIQKYPFLLAFIVGLFPALIWLWFWLKEDKHPEPMKMISLSFLGGVVAVLFVLPFQELVCDYLKTQCAAHVLESWSNKDILIFTIWAAMEELSKFSFAYFIALRHKCTDEPVDNMIYLIVSALGFVTLENSLFLLKSINTLDVVDTIVNGNLRFIGASLLHIMTSATVGLLIALSFYKTRGKRIVATLIGLIIAIVLHTSFNLFIINGAPGNIFFIFGMVWVGIIILLLMFEKVKHLKK
jgi:RsiW-degrading membrane proteinase PrsW (M82 family)